MWLCGCTQYQKTGLCEQGVRRQMLCTAGQVTSTTRGVGAPQRQGYPLTFLSSMAPSAGTQLKLLNMVHDCTCNFALHILLSQQSQL